MVSLTTRVTLCVICSHVYHYTRRGSTSHLRSQYRMMTGTGWVQQLVFVFLQRLTLWGISKPRLHVYIPRTFRRLQRWSEKKAMTLSSPLWGAISFGGVKFRKEVAGLTVLKSGFVVVCDVATLAVSRAKEQWECSVHSRRGSGRLFQSRHCYRATW